MQVTLASRRSPDAASNEDFIAATAGCVVVVDGASVPAELGTGCAHGTAWFARRLGTQLLALVTSQPDHSPADNLAQAITDVAALHADTCDLDHPGTPSATVAILREQPDTIDYLVLGIRPSCWSSRPASGRSPTTGWNRSPPCNTTRCTSRPPAPQPMPAASLSSSPNSAATAIIPTASGSPAPTRPPPTTPLSTPLPTRACTERPRSATVLPASLTDSAWSTGPASWQFWPSRDQTRSSPRSERPNTAIQMANAGRVASDTTTPRPRSAN